MMYFADVVDEVKTEATSDINVITRWLASFGDTAVNFLVKVVIAIVTYFIARIILKWLLKFIDNRLRRHGVDASVRSFVHSIIKYSVLTFVLASIIVQLNIVQAASIAALVASAGVGVSLALQGALSNFAGGLLLILTKPFRASDYIKIPSEDVEGTVRKIEMYYTTIETYDGKTVSIPNSTLTNHAVINYTKLGDRKMEIKVGVAYDSDLEKVKKALEKVLDADIRFKKDDRQIFVDEFDASSIVVGFRAHINPADYYPAIWDVKEAIIQEFGKQKIEIPFDQLDVNIRK